MTNPTQEDVRIAKLAISYLPSLEFYTPGELADWLERKDLEYYSSDECYDMKREVVALLRKLEPRPIESAPRTGEYIIINGMKDGSLCEAKWFGKYNNWKIRNGNFVESTFPTHWWPLDVLQMPKDKE